MFSRNSISSHLDRRAAINEALNELIIDNVYGMKLPETFNAIILPNSTTAPGGFDQARSRRRLSDGQVYYFIRVRPMVTSRFILASPFQKMPKAEAITLINQHPMAFMIKGDQQPIPGDLYSCRLHNMRSKTGIEILEKKSDTNETLRRSDGTAYAGYGFSGDGSNTNRGSGRRDYSEATKLSRNYTYQEYKILAPGVMPILDMISKGEGRYNSYNCGGAGVRCSDKVQEQWGKRPHGDPPGNKALVDATVGEIKTWMAKRRYGLSKGLFAVGRYQLTQGYREKKGPNVFKKAVKRMQIPETAIFNPELQDAMGAYLLMSVKRPRIHGYLAGKHNNVQETMKRMAMEWASLPVPYGMNGRAGWVNKGQSYYAGDSAGNKASSSHKVDDIMADLPTWREFLLSDPRRRSILQGE